MSEKPALVHVHIFGQDYAVRAGAEPGYVEQLAAFVDERMREVGRSSTAVDSLRIAVLAALNIADELHRLRTEGASGDSESQRRAEALARELQAALDE